MSTHLHLDALERARTAMAATEASATTTVVQRSEAPPSNAVAVLASFTGEHLVIFPLWSGVNRIGAKPPLSDYEPPPKRWLESRQWLLFIHGAAAFVVDDRTTNQSCVIQPGVPRLESVVDRRFERCSTMPSELFGASGATRLDWHGTVSATLEDGTALFSAYAGFVFGWL